MNGASGSDATRFEDLPSEILLTIINNVPVSTRLQHVELVNKRLLRLSRCASAWEQLVLQTDPQWRKNVSIKLLRSLITHSTLCSPECPVRHLDLRSTLTCLCPGMIELILTNMPHLQELLAEHPGKPVLHVDAWLEATEVYDMAFEPEEGYYEALRLEVLLGKLQQHAAQLVIHGLVLSHDDEPELEFSDVWSNHMLQQLLVHPASKVTWLDILDDTIPCWLFDNVLAHAHTLRSLRMRVGCLDTDMIGALSRAMTHQALNLSRLSVFAEGEVDEDDENARDALITAAAGWIKHKASLEVMELMVEPPAWRRCPEAFALLVNAVAERKATARACKGVWVGMAHADDCAHARVLAEEKGVDDVVYVW